MNQRVSGGGQSVLNVQSARLIEQEQEIFAQYMALDRSETWFSLNHILSLLFSNLSIYFYFLYL